MHQLPTARARGESRAQRCAVGLAGRGLGCQVEIGALGAQRCHARSALRLNELEHAPGYAEIGELEESY